MRLIAGIPAKVNLIPFNPWPGSAYVPSTRERLDGFARDGDGGRVLEPGAHAAGAGYPGGVRAVTDRERANAAGGLAYLRSNSSVVSATDRVRQIATTAISFTPSQINVPAE